MKHITLNFGPVTRKSISTPNHFVSHMIEHIAWRMGCSIDLQWDDEQWQDLGYSLGQAIGQFPAVNQQAAALGMIDDGSAEVAVAITEEPYLQLRGCAQLELDYFLSLRCEQLDSGTPLVELLKGLAEGAGVHIDVIVCSFFDTHHTWEGVFRGIGTALYGIYGHDSSDRSDESFSVQETHSSNPEGVTSSRCSCMAVTVSRSTAESELELSIDFNAPPETSLQYVGTPIDHFDGTEAFARLTELINSIAFQCGFNLNARFTSKALSSSHVLLEDLGMVMGRALREIMVLRMEDKGINGAGSSIQHLGDITAHRISIGISVEGRKSCLFVPLANERSELYKKFIIGHNIAGCLYTEDLDDFFEGFTWGMGCSLIFHFKQIPDVENGWRELFSHFGKALNQVFEINHSRKGVPPGVKANLY